MMDEGVPHTTTARMGKAAGSLRDCSHSQKEFANRVHRQQ